MIEKQSVNGKEVWIKVDPQPVERENPNIIPTEYFIATCYRSEPTSSSRDGERVLDEDGNTRLFESPVAALTAVRKHVERSSGSTQTNKDELTAQTQQEQKETD